MKMESQEKSPAEDIANMIQSKFGLENIGLRGYRKAYWNLPTEALYEEVIFRREGSISRGGPIIVNTGKHTARAANDKFIVREPESESHIWWGSYNRPYSANKFDDLLTRMLAYFQGRDLFVQDCYGGSDSRYRLPVRVITEEAWHSLFTRNMLLKPKTDDEYRDFKPGFTLIVATGFKSVPKIDDTPSNTFIIINFAKRLCIIGNTGYGGEIKKAVFTVMNYLLPLNNVMTMHCSANIGEKNDTALFFGLSGTGKTSLSADPARGLIGDDEHGWSDDGIFNFEDGCYAKVIKLSETAEPQIYACTKRYGTILENVVFDPKTRAIDLNDSSLTENTRASYPLDFIENSVPGRTGGHPRNIIFLTCDASGVMPPIARLTEQQAMYHFISGYTSKIAGTEIGLRDEPETTFSPCFGGPFMVHRPAHYAELLKRKIADHGTKCWLVNTGWVGGGYGVGKRISIQYTRNLLNSVLAGKLDAIEHYVDPVFGFSIPNSCPGVPDELLHPAGSWKNENEYWEKYRNLARRFVDNMKKFDGLPGEVLEAGPIP